jgi:hypothetical protein
MTCDQHLQDRSVSVIKSDTKTKVDGEHGRKLLINNPNKRKVRIIKPEELAKKCRYNGKKCDRWVEIHSRDGKSIEQVIFVEFKRRSNEDAFRQIEETVSHAFVKGRTARNVRKHAFIIGKGCPRLSPSDQIKVDQTFGRLGIEIKAISGESHTISIQ